jgi:hypothetical protein
MLTCHHKTGSSGFPLDFIIFFPHIWCLRCVRSTVRAETTDLNGIGGPSMFTQTSSNTFCKEFLSMRNGILIALD